MCPNENIAAMLRQSFDGTPAIVATTLPKVEKGKVFQMIICIPALGQTSRQSEGADGFGAK